MVVGVGGTITSVTLTTDPTEWGDGYIDHETFDFQGVLHVPGGGAGEQLRVHNPVTGTVQYCTVTAAGSGYTSISTVSIGSSPGGIDDQAYAEAVMEPCASFTVSECEGGDILTWSVAVNSGYNSLHGHINQNFINVDAVTLTGGGSGAVFDVATVGGVIAAGTPGGLSLVSGGIGYEVGDTFNFLAADLDGNDGVPVVVTVLTVDATSISIQLELDQEAVICTPTDPWTPPSGYTDAKAGCCYDCRDVVFENNDCMDVDVTYIDCATNVVTVVTVTSGNTVGPLCMVNESWYYAPVPDPLLFIATVGSSSCHP